MQSFNVQYTFYNPEIIRRHKVTKFILHCLFDIGKQWEVYKPPCSGVLVHIVRQLIGKYKEGNNKKLAVLISDFKILSSPGNVYTMASGSTNTSSLETSVPTKRRYRPKSSKMITSPITLERSMLVTTTTLDMLGKPSQVQSMIDIKQWRPKRIRQGR